MITIVVAADEGGVIGNGNALPWRLPADLARFKALTMGHPIVMGRRTWESLPKRPLPGRSNIVVSRDPRFEPAGCVVARSLADAVAGRDDVMIIGGATVYAEALTICDRIMLTVVHARFTGDAYFRYDAHTFVEVARTDYPADDANAHATTLVELHRTHHAR